MERLRAALRAVTWHLAVSLVVVVLAATLVFGVWFPDPYGALAGGTKLFLLLAIVDVVCGPLLTAVLYTPKKPKRELFQDLTLVALIQLSALGYGLYTVALTRPLYLAFEVDRFQVVSAADVQMEKLKPELGGLQSLPWMGPVVIGTRRPHDSDDMFKSLDLSIQGYEPSARPDWWQAYELSKADVLKMAKPIHVLRDKQPDSHDLIDAAVLDSGVSESSLKWLPVTSFRTTSWVALVDAESAAVVGFAPVDGF